MTSSSRADGAFRGADGAARRVEVIWSLVVALGWIIGAVYLTQVASLPRGIRQDLSDTAAHGGLGVLVAGCLICVVRAVGYQGRPLVVGGMAATGASMCFLVGTELLQSSSSSRQPEIGDAVADLVGAAVGAGILLLFFRARPPLPRFAAAGFLGVASAMLLVTVVVVVNQPPSSVVERPRSVLEASVVDGARCLREVRDVRAADGQGVAVSAREPAVAPLVRFDFATALDHVDGSLALLQLDPQGAVGFRPGVGAAFDGGDGVLSSAEPAEELLGTLADGQQFSVEAWVDLDDAAQVGPARIVSLASGTRRDDSILHLGVEGNQLSVRLRTSCDPTNWFLVDGLTPGLHHVALTYDRGRVVIFVDGHHRMTYRLEGVALGPSTTPVPLNIGNEMSRDRGLRGTVSIVAFWPKALSADEVAWLTSVDERFSLPGP